MMIFIAGLSCYTTRQIVHLASHFSKLKQQHSLFIEDTEKYFNVS